MSRIGKIPVVLPSEAKVNITPSEIAVEGPKGKLTHFIAEGIQIKQEEKQIVFERMSQSKQARANHGTMRALVKNMIEGVVKGHEKNLEIQGIGFRCQVQGQKITMNLGFSHPVEFVVPEGITASAPKPTEIKLEGADKILLGQVAAKIRAIKQPEPYKGKGIRYAGENVRRKQGKSAK